MHFVIVTPYFPSAADANAGSFIERQALALRSRGHRVDVIHLQPRPPLLSRSAARWHARLALPARECRDGIDVYRAPYLSTTTRPSLRRFQALAVQRAVRATLREHPHLTAADVLYAQWLVPFGYGCLHAARHMGLPCIAIARGADLTMWAAEPALRRQLRTVVHDADAVLGNGEWALDAIRRATGQPVNRVIDVVYNPSDLTSFLRIDRDDVDARVAARREFGLPDDVPLLLFLGRLDPDKGIDTLFAAFHRLDASWHLVLAGDGPIKQSLIARAETIGVRDRVSFLGTTAHALVPRLMTACDVFALPSRREGVPNVVVEALAACLPVVATPVGGSAEVVIAGRTGWLVPPDRPIELAAAIIEAHASRDEGRARATAGRTLVRDLFDVDRNLDRLEAVVRRVRRVPAVQSEETHATASRTAALGRPA